MKLVGVPGTAPTDGAGSRGGGNGAGFVRLTEGGFEALLRFVRRNRPSSWCCREANGSKATRSQVETHLSRTVEGMGKVRFVRTTTVSTIGGTVNLFGRSWASGEDSPSLCCAICD